MNPRAPYPRQTQLFEQCLPPHVSIVEKFSAMHFQIDKPKLPEQIRLRIVISSTAQLSGENSCDYSKPLASALLGLDESVV